MRLTGALSNHDVAKGLDALLDRKRGLASPVAGAGSKPERMVRLPQGAIQAAVHKVLRLAVDPLSPGQVHALIESLLGRPVSKDTVGSLLSVASRSEKQPVVRVGHGQYQAGPLARSTPLADCGCVDSRTST